MLADRRLPLVRHRPEAPLGVQITELRQRITTSRIRGAAFVPKLLAGARSQNMRPRSTSDKGPEKRHQEVRAPEAHAVVSWTHSAP